MKRNKIFFYIICCFFATILSAQDTLISDSVFAKIDSSQKNIETDTIGESKTRKISIVFAGDIMGHDTQIEGAYVDSIKSYDYEPTFRYIKDYISSADIAVGNLEVTLAGPPFKGYPQFSSPDELAVEAKEAGFDVFITANNHALDRGYKGVERTISVLDSLNIIHAGIYRSPEEKELRYPLIIEKKGIRIALLNYTYGTNGLKVNLPYSVNYIDTAKIRKDISKAQLAEPDYIISTLHWGKEYERDENARQRRLAGFLFKNGVDAVIGSHPHVVQPLNADFCVDDTSKRCPIIFSMGNFVSNQRSQYKDGGVMVELHLSGGNETVQFDSISYLPYWVYRKKVKEEKYIFYVLPVAKYENDSTIVDFTDNDLYKFNRFKNDTRTHLKDSKESSFYDKVLLE